MRISWRLAVIASCLGAGHCFAAPDLRQVVDGTIEALMRQQGITGLSLAVVRNGQTQYFNYGLASKEGRQPVTEDTLFEIGSISKTFTATLAGYAQAAGRLKLSDPASSHLPALRGSAFDHISLLQLGTYTAGGLPLQFPPESDDAGRMIGYFQHWKAEGAPGTQRLYSNPSIGLLGYLAAQSLGQPFDRLMEKTLLPRLGLKHTYTVVPKSQMKRYAQGYARDGRPVRVGPGALDSEAYGVKTSAADLIRYVELNMNPGRLEQPLQQAIATTHTAYYRVGGTLQGLGWEMYPYPVTLEALLAGNSAPMALELQQADWLMPPQAPSADRLVNKTGSTGGFGAYVAYIPGRQLGIVILANRNYPNAERVKAAHAILGAMDR